jgi:hypothetical protein
MLDDILKSERFNVAFSLLLGLFLATLLRPVCKGYACNTYKQPPTDDIREHAYKLGSKCYEFVAEDVQCPNEGIVEPFAWKR